MTEDAVLSSKDYKEHVDDRGMKFPSGETKTKIEESLEQTKARLATLSSELTEIKQDLDSITQGENTNNNLLDNAADRIVKSLLNNELAAAKNKNKDAGSLSREFGKLKKTGSNENEIGAGVIEREKEFGKKFSDTIQNIIKEASEESINQDKVDELIFDLVATLSEHRNIQQYNEKHRGYGSKPNPAP